MTMAVPGAAPATFPGSPDESLRATAEYITAAMSRPDVVILDVCSPAEWRGENDRGNRRAGHIPGAVHIEWLNNIEGDEGRRCARCSRRRA